MEHKFLCKGRIIEQKSLSVFKFSTETCTFTVQLINSLNYFPIQIYTILYTLKLINGGFGEIIYAERVEWSRSLHRHFFSSLVYNPDPSAEIYHSKPIKNYEFQRWYHLDVDAINIMPNITTCQYISIIKEANFEKLIIDFPGSVLPWVLSKYVGMHHPLVKEASVLRYITSIMKQKHKVWLDSTDIGLLLCDFAEPCQSLIKKNVIVYDSKNSFIGLKWAIDFLNKYQSKLESGEITVEFLLGALPTHLSSKTKYFVDPRLPCHKLIDYSMLPSSFLLKDIPTPLPSYLPEIQFFSSWKEIQQKFSFNSPVICVSDNGTYRWSRKTEIAILNQKIDPFETKSVVQISTNLTQPNYYILQNESKTYNVPLTYINDKIQLVSSIKFEMLEQLDFHKVYGVFVIIVSSFTPEEWLYRAQKYAVKNQVVFVKIKY